MKDQDLSELLDDLSDAINHALWNSGHVLNAIAALEEAVGDFRISIDVLLPGVMGLNPQQSDAETTEADVQFLRSMKIEP